MPHVTIPDLDQATLDRLSAEARRRNLDVGVTAGELLRERLGAPAGGPAAMSDLDSLAGTWSAEEAGAFLSAVADFGRVDPGLWK